MKIQEAIKYWEGSKREAEVYFERGKIGKKFKEQLIFYDMAIEALNKQIPMPPAYIDKYIQSCIKHECQNCKVYFVNWETFKTNYCGNCGQKLREAE